MAIHGISVKDLKIYILFAPILMFYISISKYLKFSMINIIQYKKINIILMNWLIF